MENSKQVLRNLFSSTEASLYHLPEKGLYLFIFHSEEKFKRFLNIIAANEMIYDLVYGSRSEGKIEISLLISDSNGSRMNPQPMISYQLKIYDTNLFNLIISKLSKN
jgi:hypothetical protein